MRTKGYLRSVRAEQRSFVVVKKLEEGKAQAFQGLSEMASLMGRTVNSGLFNVTLGKIQAK
jgi:hypothetical protein